MDYQQNPANQRQQISQETQQKSHNQQGKGVFQLKKQKSFNINTPRQKKIKSYQQQKQENQQEQKTYLKDREFIQQNSSTSLQQQQQQQQDQSKIKGEGFTEFSDSALKQNSGIKNKQPQFIIKNNMNSLIRPQSAGNQPNKEKILNNDNKNNEMNNSNGSNNNTNIKDTHAKHENWKVKSPISTSRKIINANNFKQNNNNNNEKKRKEIGSILNGMLVHDNQKNKLNPYFQQQSQKRNIQKIFYKDSNKIVFQGARSQQRLPSPSSDTEKPSQQSTQNLQKKKNQFQQLQPFKSNTVGDTSKIIKQSTMDNLDKPSSSRLSQSRLSQSRSRSRSPQTLQQQQQYKKSIMLRSGIPRPTTSSSHQTSNNNNNLQNNNNMNNSNNSSNSQQNLNGNQKFQRQFSFKQAKNSSNINQIYQGLQNQQRYFNNENNNNTNRKIKTNNNSQNNSQQDSQPNLKIKRYNTTSSTTNCTHSIRNPNSSNTSNNNSLNNSNNCSIDHNFSNKKQQLNNSSSRKNSGSNNKKQQDQLQQDDSNLGFQQQQQQKILIRQQRPISGKRLYSSNNTSRQSSASSSQKQQNIDSQNLNQQQQQQKDMKVQRFRYCKKKVKNRQQLQMQKQQDQLQEQQLNSSRDKSISDCNSSCSQCQEDEKIYNLNDMVLEENKDQIKQIYENFPKVEKIIQEDIKGEISNNNSNSNKISSKNNSQLENTSIKLQENNNNNNINIQTDVNLFRQNTSSFDLKKQQQQLLQINSIENIQTVLSNMSIEVQSIEIATNRNIPDINTNNNNIEQQENQLDNNNNQIQYIINIPEIQDEQKDQDSQQEDFPVKGEIIKWKQVEMVGSGSFGQVFKAKNIEDNSFIAVKRLVLTDQYQTELDNEIKIMKKLDSNHIVKYYGHEQLEDKYMYIYMEYMDKGSLHSQLQIDEGKGLDESLIKKYSKQILMGLLDLHNEKIVHKDIKTGNILVDSQGNVKIADFGNSKLLELSLKSFKNTGNLCLKGSIPWMPPEIIRNRGYKKSADVWSFGCTVIEMVTGKLPWSEVQTENHIGLMMNIGKDGNLPQIPESVSPSLKDFIYSCLQREKNQRPKVQDLLQHPFLQE